ncbi:MAG: hypothetical protein KKG95_07945 [Candidatus Omnitrophica bacterium]|nr:hypothetical protein [Candidatus Omnitrophota bacterium]
MKSYWDMTEKQRSQLTEEEVEALTSFELMQHGIVRVGPAPVEPDVPDVPEPDLTFYAVKQGYSNTLHFNTTEAAHAAARAGVHLESAYCYTTETYRLHVGTNEPAVTEVKAYSAALWESIKEQVDKHDGVRKAYVEQKKEHDDLLEKQNKALDSLWSNWYTCKVAARQVKRVLATRDEYIQLTNGDEAMARTFLMKAFSEKEITEALEWEEEA